MAGAVPFVFRFNFTNISFLSVLIYILHGWRAVTVATATTAVTAAEISDDYDGNGTHTPFILQLSEQANDRVYK